MSTREQKLKSEKIWIIEEGTKGQEEDPEHFGILIFDLSFVRNDFKLPLIEC